MNKLYKWCWALLGTAYIFFIFWGLWCLAPSAVVILCGVALLVIIWLIKERLRTKREGYYVYTKGGAESGSIHYNESGQELQLYFERPTHTIYVPSDLKWRDTMPAWAVERKQEIMHRIQTQLGRWTYEQSDLQSFSRSQR